MSSGLYVKSKTITEEHEFLIKHLLFTASLA